jgi:DNA-directed RNA polymerase specialized sigma24 family protein
MTKLLETVRRVERLEEELRAARAQLREDIRAAHASGESMTELARRLGISRTRVHQLLRDD